MSPRSQHPRHREEKHPALPFYLGRSSLKLVDSPRRAPRWEAAHRADVTPLSAQCPGRGVQGHGHGTPWSGPPLHKAMLGGTPTLKQPLDRAPSGEISLSEIRQLSSPAASPSPTPVKPPVLLSPSCGGVSLDPASLISPCRGGRHEWTRLSTTTA